MTTDQPDAAPPSAEAADRLARLAARRRPPADSVAPTAATDPAGVAGAAETRSAPTPAKRERRPPPARSSKIITVGASTTAMLGMMAGFAIADRPALPAGSAPAESASAAPAPTLPPAPSTQLSPPTTTQPVVVLATPVTAPVTTPPTTPPTAPPPPPTEAPATAPPPPPEPPPPADAESHGS